MLALLLALVAGSSGTAYAHADLLRAEPAAGSELPEAPRQLTLYFSQGLKMPGSFVQVRDVDGTQAPVEFAVDASDSKIMRVNLGSTLGAGIYTVRWQTLSADDDDYHDGTFTLTVLNPDGSRPGAAASAADNGEDGGSDTLLLAGVTIVVVLAVAATAAFVRKSSRRAA